MMAAYATLHSNERVSYRVVCVLPIFKAPMLMLPPPVSEMVTLFWGGEGPLGRQ